MMRCSWQRDGQLEGFPWSRSRSPGRCQTVQEKFYLNREGRKGLAERYSRREAKEAQGLSPQATREMLGRASSGFLVPLMEGACLGGSLVQLMPKAPTARVLSAAY